MEKSLEAISLLNTKCSGTNVIKLFWLQLAIQLNKLERLIQENISAVVQSSRGRLESTLVSRARR